MKLDCLFIHVPKFNNHYRCIGHYMHIMHIPNGVFSIADWINRNGYSTKIIHIGIEIIKNKNFSLINFIKIKKSKIIGIPLHWHSQSYDVIQIAKKIKTAIPETFIVLGGFTASFFDEEILNNFREIDAVIRGDGEKSFLNLIKEINSTKCLEKVPNLVWRKDGKIIRNKKNYVANSKDLNKFNFTNLSLLSNYEAYIKSSIWIRKPDFKTRKRATFYSTYSLPIERGCSVNCSYCGGSAISQKIINKRSSVIRKSIKSVIKSMKDLEQYGYERVFINCPNPLEDQNYLVTLLKEMKKNKIKLHVLLNTTQLPTTQLLLEFKKNLGTSKKSKFCLSPETSDDKLRRLNKGFFYSKKDFIKKLKEIEKLKMYTDIYFTVGLPYETKKDLIELKKFQKFLKKEFKYIKIFTFSVELEPCSPLYLYPSKYKCKKERFNFIDYYNAHSNKKYSSHYDLGYYNLNYYKNYKGNKNYSRSYAQELQKYKCTKCRFYWLKKPICYFENMLFNLWYIFRKI